MSGIAGIVYPDAYQINHLINPMLTTLTHRGKNIQTHTYKNIEIGMCGGLLAKNSFGAAGLDGRLQHRDRIKQALIEKNCPAADFNDAELILNAYEQWGSDFLKQIQGEFALFILDHKKERLFLARDRIGKKPLYWYHEQNTFLFSSEIKALLGSGAVPQTPNTEALATYLFFGYIPQDLSPIKGVNKLLPGYYLQLNRDQSKTIDAYWSYSSFFDTMRNPSDNQIATDLDKILQNNVRACIPDNKPFSCLLSGGLGSASIAYFIKKITKKEGIHAYTVAFEGENESDIKTAEAVANHLNYVQSTDLVTPQNFLNDFVKIVWYLDEPLADPNVLATWQMAKLAKPGEVVLSGMGSDELFAGHTRYALPKNKTNSVSSKINHFLKGALLPLLNLFYKSGVYAILQRSRTEPWQLHFLNQNAVFNRDLLAEVAPRLAPLFDPHVFLHKFHNMPHIQSKISALLYFDVKTRLPDCYVLQLERLMSAHGVDWRVPYLTKEVFEYVASLPATQQLSENETHKYLKAILKNALPDAVVYRPKTLRKDFLKSWSAVPEVSELFHMLPEGILAETGLISPKWIRDQLASPYIERATFKLLWSVLALEVWFRLFIKSPVQLETPTISLKELLNQK